MTKAIMVRVCCDCEKVAKAVIDQKLRQELLLMSIIGCVRQDKTVMTCQIDCPTTTEFCATKYDHNIEASHGFCGHHFNLRMKEVKDEKGNDS